MKKALLIILVSTFIFISCNDEDMKINPFVGTWEYIAGSGYLNFTNNKITMYYENDDIYWSGIYSFNEIQLTVTLDKELSHQDIILAYGETGLLYNKYEFEDDLLILYNPAQFKYRRVIP